MTKAFLLAHGSTYGGRKFFVPPHVTLHHYARPGETVSALVAADAIAGARVRTAETVPGGAESGLVELTPLEPEQITALRSLALNSSEGAQLVLFPGEDVPGQLCTQPHGGVSAFVPRRTPCTARAHADSCHGVFRARTDITELHVIACRNDSFRMFFSRLNLARAPATTQNRLVTGVGPDGVGTEANDYSLAAIRLLLGLRRRGSAVELLSRYADMSENTRLICQVAPDAREALAWAREQVERARTTRVWIPGPLLAEVTGTAERDLWQLPRITPVVPPDLPRYLVAARGGWRDVFRLWAERDGMSADGLAGAQIAALVKASESPWRRDVLVPAAPQGQVRALYDFFLPQEWTTELTVLHHLFPEDHAEGARIMQEYADCEAAGPLFEDHKQEHFEQHGTVLVAAFDGTVYEFTVEEVEGAAEAHGIDDLEVRLVERAVQEVRTPLPQTREQVLDLRAEERTGARRRELVEAAEAVFRRIDRGVGARLARVCEEFRSLEIAHEEVRWSRSASVATIL
ncbi:hypothetical protein [Streptomyces sp. NPDC059918]|uniref:hypothetical protein n=1 Tax=unclassified Streptomyces TaxID=2593676 RepID=UPI00364EEA91